MTASARPSTLNHDASAARVKTEAELVAACLAGDAMSERALYDQHLEALHRLAFRLCGDPDMAADITQEAFIRAFAGLHQFRGAAALRTWLTSILLQATGEIMRKGRWLRDRTGDLDARIPSPPGPPRDTELASHLDAAIAALPDTLRAVLVMHDVEGFTHVEIGAAIGIPTGTSKARLTSARVKLRTALANHWRDRTL
jgi:RNA polymerase sigma-70 factor (ECF subfamily)